MLNFSGVLGALRSRPAPRPATLRILALGGRAGERAGQAILATLRRDQALGLG